MIRRGNFDASQAFEDAWRARDRAQVSDAEVRELVRTAEMICRAATAEPSPSFRTSLRDRLMAEAADVLVASPVHEPVRPIRTATSPRRRRVASLAAALVASVGTVGTVASSASAIPGDMLYPVKRGVENVQVAFHRDDAARGEYRLQQARERLAEAQALDHRGDAERLAATLDDFAAQAETGTDELFAAYASDSADANIETINDFIAEASLSLASLSDAVPTDARDSFASATTLVTGLADQTTQLCTSCSSADISSLIDSVQSLTSNSDSATKVPSVPASTTPQSASVTNPVTGLLPGGTTSTPKGDTIGRTPVPAPTTSPVAGVGGALSNTLDAVVGEDGLVNGLLGGLLGTGK